MLQLRELSRANLETCVHCGFCLEVCPTYRELGIEDDSPRGRMYLIRNLAAGVLEPTPRVMKHLDLCLDCRACESSCPSGVKYGVIIEDARSRLEEARERSFWDVRARNFFMNRVFPKPARLRRLARALRWVQRLKLDRAAIMLRLVSGRTAALADAARVPGRFGSDVLPEFVPARGLRRHTVAFVQGCVSDVMFGPTNIATVRVLAANGCDVRIPAGQTCCGGLAFHFGDLEQARRQARQNIDAFLAPDVEYIITNVAGCGSTLKEYDNLLAEDPGYAGKAREFAAKVRDVSEFLAAIEPVPPANPVPLKVAYQDACHLAHGQGIRWQPRKMLSLIPGLELVSLPESDTCCGSAGIYNIVQPEMADALLRNKMRCIARSGAQTVAVANAGCMMQLKLGVRQYGPEVEVMHVIDLLDRAYGAERVNGRERHG
jgi:glycolate oxidase iron-sulfur subunit